MTVKLNLPTYSFKIKKEDSKILIFDDIRKKYLVCTPEEWVRQNFIRFLIHEKTFPAQLMVIESGLKVNNKQFRTDLLIYGRDGKPLLVVEFKAPNVKISQNTFDQIARYNMQLKVPFLIVSNGIDHYCCKVDFENKSYSFLKQIPEFSQLN